MKRITILPEKMPDECKSILFRLYGQDIQEIDSKSANELLVKCSPKDLNSSLRAFKQQRPVADATSNNAADSSEAAEVFYCRFPQTGPTSATVTSKDYLCLEDESFLNDSILEFYLSWLQVNWPHFFHLSFCKTLTSTALCPVRGRP